MQSSDTEELNVFLQKSVEEGCEGLMVKTLEENARYLPSKRSLNWLKLKKVRDDALLQVLSIEKVCFKKCLSQP